MPAWETWVQQQLPDTGLSIPLGEVDRADSAGNRNGFALLLSPL